jgi:hypothetical protein
MKTIYDLVAELSILLRKAPTLTGAYSMVYPAMADISAQIPHRGSDMPTTLYANSPKSMTEINSIEVV